MPNKWKDEETSPDRTVVWTEPLTNRLKYSNRVPVVYYLSSNGQLQHPHFIEVPLSSPDGLYLRDVINRLNFLRGIGMASRYSWSCKRSYKNGYVWHDLAENDFIYPAHGREYILKGSELPEGGALISEPNETVAKHYEELAAGIGNYGGDVDNTAIRRRRHQSFDMHEYKVYKEDYTREALCKAFADASTQTDDKRRRRRAVRVVENEEEKQNEEKREESPEIIPSTELNKDEIPPPPSDSSPETLGKLMKADRRLMLRLEKSKGSSVFMQLLSCGATSFNDCGPSGSALISQYKARLPRVGRPNQVEKGAENVTVEKSSSIGKVTVENKEYFSGSLVETKKTESPALMRSSSYNADR